MSFEVVVGETDLQISARRDLTDEAGDLVARARWEIEEFIRAHPRFKETLAPYDVPEDAGPLVRAMSRAGWKANVGPMAAVAGVIAEYVAKGLEPLSAEVIVENGGDIYMVGAHDRQVALWAGDSPVSGKVALEVRAALMPLAVCTSSGKVGHSLSFGAADAATVLSRDGALADAVATALANRVHSAEDVTRAVDAAKQVPGVLGVVVVFEDTLGAWGDVHLAPIGS